MNEEQEKWEEDVFLSMKGSRRARPQSALLAKIEDQLARSSTKVVPLRQWRFAVAATILILLVNSMALYTYYYQENYSDMAVVDHFCQSFIRSYQIYE